MATVTGETCDATTYRTTPEPFWQGCLMRGDDGYDVMEVAMGHGWRALPSWGRDGWDLGSWPLVVIYYRTRPGQFDLAEYVEGDVTTWRFPTSELRGEAIDRLAFDHWKYKGEPWVEGVATAADAPAHLRGRYRECRTTEAGA